MHRTFRGRTERYARVTDTKRSDAAWAVPEFEEVSLREIPALGSPFLLEGCRRAASRMPRGRAGRHSPRITRGVVTIHPLLVVDFDRPSLTPAARACLIQRGVDIQPEPGETLDATASRLETQLMLAFQESGTSADFEALYAHARGPLLIWIVSLAAGRRTGVDSAELLQDTFVNIYRYARSFRDHGPRSFRVWSRTIAGNLVRRSRFETRRSFQALPEGMQEPTDRRAGPDSQLFEAEDQRILHYAWLLLLTRYAAAYDQLTERDRQALTLIEVDGLSYQAACRRLGVGLSNLKMILFRARRRIRAAISADFGVPLVREPAVRLKRAG